MSGNLFDKQSTDTTTKSPWAAQAPYLNQGFQYATNLYNQGPYQGPFIGAQSPYTVQAQQMLAQKATDPNSLAAMTQRQLGSTIAGDYLNPQSNPYLSQYVSDALGQAKSAFLSQYGGQAGNNLYNSGYQESLARGLGSAATNAYMGAYNTERQNQLNAAYQGPQYDYAQAQALFGAGQSQEARSQAEANAQQQAYMSSWNNLANYLNAIKGDYGATVNTPYHTNPFGNALGGALGIGALSKMFGGGGSGGGTVDYSGQDLSQADYSGGFY